MFFSRALAAVLIVFSVATLGQACDARREYAARELDVHEDAVVPGECMLKSDRSPGHAQCAILQIPKCNTKTDSMSSPWGMSFVCHFYSFHVW